MTTPEGCGGCGVCVGCVVKRAGADRPHGEAGANARIAELESKLRKRETHEHERFARIRAQHNETTERMRAEIATRDKVIAELRLEKLDLEGRVEAMNINSNVSSETAAVAIGRLLSCEPVVKAARSLCKAYKDKNDKAAADACEELIQGVESLPPEPS